MIEKNKTARKIHEIFLTAENEIMLKDLIRKIERLVNQNEIPPIEKDRKCKKCAYYPYCYI